MRGIFFGISALGRETSLMVSSILIGITLWLHGKVSPFNSTMNNTIESLFLFNLLVVFIVSLYKPLTAVVNIFVSIAMVQLVCIAMYKGCGLVENVFTITRLSCIKKAMNYFINFKEKTVRDANQIELVNAVPEVTFNYKEFQEPLLAVRHGK